MPKRDDIHRIMIIGSGPIIIGQAGEFDYSGSQACKALRKMGYEIILVNSNPATIMTDPVMADTTYIEPLNLETMQKIIEKERPDALLPNLGGQSGLNLSSELYKSGILDKYNVKIIGVQPDAIERGEDRTAFKNTMNRLGIEMPQSEAVNTVDDAERAANQLGYPVVIRPAYTMGGTGGGLVYNLEELKTIAARGIQASLVGQILVEESVLGWEELELEVVRDAKNQMITVCFIENVDPMGVHTGDSFCTAPMLTIASELQKKLQEYSYKIVEAIQVIGGTNIQFAHDPQTGRVVVIEINPRTSRSSALASKATGFPIALVSSFLAGGLNLNEIPYWRDGTLDKYTPSGEYVVVKFARWAFEKYKGVYDRLGTQMRAVGEVMSIGKSYKEAFQKAIRSLENGRQGLGFAKNFNKLSLPELLGMLAEPSSERQFILYEAIRKGADLDELFQKTRIKMWFLTQMKELVGLEEEILKYKNKAVPDALLARAKADGFSDKYLAQILGKREQEIRGQRLKVGVVERWEPVPVSGVENSAYYYSSYSINPASVPLIKIARKEAGKKIMILGGGPYRIGQGIEFDYCCCHCSFALKEMGVETIIVNCNPETVSTDYDTSDRLYFEPLTVEDVLSIYANEKPDGLVVQFGGQTPLNIARELEEQGVRVLGTSTETIDLAEDRDRFRVLMQKLKIPLPQSGMASNLEEAMVIAKSIGYPLMVRPSYVLGGRGMEVVYDSEMLKRYVAAAVDVTPERPILIEKFLENATEVEADAICDGQDAFVPVVMEHIERAGIHSGDSACVLPPVSLSNEHIRIIEEYTKRIALELKVIGLMNIQYAIHDGTVYILEANPRASRTVPLVSKVCNISMARIATEIIMGKKLKDFGLCQKKFKHFGVKEAVFPFNMFPEVDPVLGPEMRSTGEVLGMASSFGLAFYKAQAATKTSLPESGTVLLSVNSQEREDLAEVAQKFIKLGFNLVTTQGTGEYLKERGIASKLVLKLHEGRPNIIDAIANKQIQLIINTPVGKLSEHDDSYIRKAAIKHKIPYVTTIAAALASAGGIKAYREEGLLVKPLQEYHKQIRE